MHNKYNNYKLWVVYSSFIIAIILQIIPFCLRTWNIHPSWTMILLIRWITILPNQVNIGTGFTLGLVIDIILGSTLGIHSLSLSILAYLVIRNIYFFRYMPIWQQTFIIIFLSFIHQSITFLIKFLITKVLYAPEIFWNCLLDGGSWPFLVFLMHKIRRN
ncbi:rod shape-determining protein MreD [Blochmannia endosymbiont of Camponotus sp. C-003]|uniref:rod shape-determining protein MreD n=1 Tax=unclassified Candidatus Blochmanniella TaxID=711328 RepID=UPI0020256D64|nr:MULTISPECIES: rod shape-determining protein MreD [unclassified Candidatus Blochmannia]URJ23513.1 rod shape-determining protein MreD [Blochmannia endosymbiont of Camponotus sp. C-003]URJ28985.1 rod shape-determining protein MreD [Blochmannia endosymbiont of Camponotus sp. C-046]